MSKEGVCPICGRYGRIIDGFCEHCWREAKEVVEWQYGRGEEVF